MANEQNDDYEFVRLIKGLEWLIEDYKSDWWLSKSGNREKIEVIEDTIKYLRRLHNGK